MERPGMQKARRAGNAVRHEGAERAARLGYACRGIVYGVVGVLALKLAVGAGGRLTDQKGALAVVGDSPFGAFLLGVLGLGLLAFAAWRFVQAVMDTESKGRSGKGMATRVMFFISGLVHMALGVAAFRELQGMGGGRSGSTQSLTGRLLEQPFGRVLVVLVGLAVLGIAVEQLHQAWTGKMLRKLGLTGMAARRRTLVQRVCRAGVAARAVVFSIMGYYLVQAGLTANPRRAKGLPEAMATLGEQPLGQVLLGVVAAGLVAFAAYQLLEARYRRIHVP